MARTATAKKQARGRLTPMRASSGFREFVLDQLADVPGLRDRAMFGGVGLYASDVFFGIIASEALYFKVDDSNRPEYERAGSTPFKPYADGGITMSYYAVPVAVLEDAPALERWAARSIGVAVAARESGKKPTKKRGKRA